MPRPKLKSVPEVEPRECTGCFFNEPVKTSNAVVEDYCICDNEEMKSDCNARRIIYVPANSVKPKEPEVSYNVNDKVTWNGEIRILNSSDTKAIRELYNLTPEDMSPRTPIRGREYTVVYKTYVPMTTAYLVAYVVKDDNNDYLILTEAEVTKCKPMATSRGYSLWLECPECEMVDPYDEYKIDDNGLNYVTCTECNTDMRIDPALPTALLKLSREN